PTNILYEFIKHMGKKSKEQICKLFNRIINEGELPKDWITSVIVLLPKPKDWEGNLNV
ncbi:7391_t:CDS:1, partial [Dentiscutata erythropus]